MWSMTPTASRMEGAVVLGLDGVPWPLLERWIGFGGLPSFERLFEEGSAGPIGSTTPASTPLAWPSITTGTWPDKHGRSPSHSSTWRRSKSPGSKRSTTWSTGRRRPSSTVTAAST
ncbi:alkaline phosphatase family protein [Halorarum salinum]|uniref:alkaline phosphatase family protein n=1 Tax=Halorarum salinum TaxID=2743089 RepID=UPI002AA29DEA|nr:alkaline phosphatase family protein [Halobaculum salinum]